MIRNPEIPGRYYLDAGRFSYYRKGELVPVWLERRTKDGAFVCKPISPDGEELGSAVFVSGKVLHRGARQSNSERTVNP